MARIVDLTLTLRAGMSGVAFAPKHVLGPDGWNSTSLSLYSHAGTHIDAAQHVEAGPETVDQIAPARCLGPAWVARIPDVRPKQLIEVADLGPVADALRPGEGLLLATGWSRYADDTERYRRQLPRVSESLARWCVARRVRMLGVEPPSVADVENFAEVGLIHRTLLGGGVLVLEGLTNLDAVREDRILLVALPLKLARIDGSPARVVAVEGLSLDHWPLEWEA